MIQESAARGEERMNDLLAPILWRRWMKGSKTPIQTWLIIPPARQPTMLPMKKRLAIQEPSNRSIWMGSPGVVPFIILGMATLEKDSQPPTVEAPKEIPMAESTFKE